MNGICAGGGYELALACDEILLVDDGNSAVSLPETPLLGVLPGTGGLTRVVDKRKVRRDLADVFCTLAEGVQGQARGGVGPRRRGAPDQQVQGGGGEARRGARGAVRSAAVGPGHHAAAAGRRRSRDSVDHVSLRVRARSTASARIADLTVRAPDGAAAVDARRDSGGRRRLWPLRAFRELDDALLRLRLNEPEIGTSSSGPKGDLEARARGRSRARRAHGRLAGARDHPVDEAHAEAHGPDRAQLLRAHRAGLALRRLALRARARRGSLLHARRSGSPERDRALADERGPAADVERPVAAADAVPRRSRSSSTSCSRETEPFDAPAAQRRRAS